MFFCPDFCAIHNVTNSYVSFQDEKVQKLKSKKEQKQLEKARRAAALIEIEKQAVEKAEKKRLKKEARALKQSENPGIYIMIQIVCVSYINLNNQFRR